MKAVISRKELVELIGKIQTIVATKPAIPILSNILIEAIDDQLVISATDLTTSKRCYLEAKVVEEGSITLPAKRFFHLVRELTAPQIKISTSGNDLAEIIAGSSVFKIHGMHKSEFPSLPKTVSTDFVSINSTMLKNMLIRTSFSATREDSRYVLNGLLLQIENRVATFTGTDGKRLARFTEEIKVDASFQGTYILPLKAVEEMIKMLEGNEQEVSLGLFHDKVILEHGSHTLITKLMAGQYPDVNRVIPEENPIDISLHREELITLLRQVALFTSDSSNSVKFTFHDGNLGLSINGDLGEGLVNMPVDYFKDSLEIAFNPFFFQDILRHRKDETVKFSIKDSYNPGVITDSTNALFVIMPMRLNENNADKEQESDVNDSQEAPTA